MSKKNENEETFKLSLGDKKSHKLKVGFLESFNNLINKNSSLLTFIVCVFVLSVLWCIFVLFANHYSIMFGWDYVSQYITFYYDYWDIWRHFFATGEFTLVDFTTYLGVDNIGSNSYYGLFDPFVIALTLFRRELIPQTFTFMTMIKIVISTLVMRSYLKYLGIKEGTARFGAIAYAFSGYMNFMLGFCSFVSVVVYVPAIMLGIEKVIKERKPTILVWSLFLLGITSFFFLVVLCIWGVMYALWRFFQTIKTRNAKENFSAMGLGVASFAVGICLCAFSLVPSLHQSTLSGRTVSIGSAYLSALLSSFKDETFKDLIFEIVGGSNAREIMPLVSFFFPTGGYLYLPMMVPSSSYKYDAWVASLFSYTPFIILFFLALLTSIRKKKFSHLIAVIVCSYFLFTDFAYFAFFAFTGNGYGRWFLILIPCIIYYGCWAWDEVPNSPRIFPAVAGLLALIGTIGTYLLTTFILDGKTFDNPNGYTYFVDDPYLTAGNYSSSYGGYTYNTIFTLLYEVVFVIVEGSTFACFTKKPWIRKFLMGCLTCEIVIMGNMNYVFCGYWNLERSYNGGVNNFSDSLAISNYINEQDDSFFRSYYDTTNGEKNFANSINANQSSAFHSLMNFECYDYAIMMKMASCGSWGESYGQEWYNPSWSAHYTNKRFATDTKQGYKYYVIKNGGYPNWESENIPFGAEFLCRYKNNTTKQEYRVYVNKDAVILGYGVDSKHLYYMQAKGEHHNSSAFYDGTQNKMMMAEDLMLYGAILDDGVEIPGLEIKNPLDANLTAPGKTYKVNDGYEILYYETEAPDYYLGGKNSGYRDEGPIYFMNHYTPVSKTKSFTYKRDLGKIVLYPQSGFGKYFNTDKDGCYFNIEMDLTSGQEPRVYMFGDTFDESGNLVEENKLLNFEYNSFATLENTGKSTFGMYARGRVKYICFCAPSGSKSPYFSCPTLHVQEYTKINERLTYIHKNELTDVSRVGKNGFKAKSNYGSKKLVVTTLAYDESWNVYANGTKIETYRADGGFLSFVADKGEISYVLDYKTVGLSLGVYLFMAGSGLYFTYIALDFLKTAKKKKSLQNLTIL